MELSAILAYIDPGSESIIFQVILAGALGFFVYLKRIKFFILGLFKRHRKDDLND
jgi:hypothetical protein